jgi:hypothetical protein
VDRLRHSVCLGRLDLAFVVATRSILPKETPITASTSLLAKRRSDATADVLRCALQWIGGEMRIIAAGLAAAQLRRRLDLRLERGLDRALPLGSCMDRFFASRPAISAG